MCTAVTGPTEECVAHLDGYRIDCGRNLKAALLKHHDRRVVDAGTCSEDTHTHTHTHTNTAVHRAKNTLACFYGNSQG